MTEHVDDLVAAGLYDPADEDAAERLELFVFLLGERDVEIFRLFTLLATFVPRELRVGLAFGDVMVRQGDFYGPIVNLAARLVSSADAGTALTDVEMEQRLARVRGGYAFAAAGKLNLAGFLEPVEAFQLLRP